MSCFTRVFGVPKRLMLFLKLAWSQWVDVYYVCRSYTRVWSVFGQTSTDHCWIQASSISQTGSSTNTDGGAIHKMPILLALSFNFSLRNVLVSIDSNNLMKILKACKGRGITAAAPCKTSLAPYSHCLCRFYGLLTNSYCSLNSGGLG